MTESISIKSPSWKMYWHWKNAINNVENPEQYENVILHVVWDHDVPVFRKDNSEIPVLELKRYVNPSVLENYGQLTASKSWVYCENQLARIDNFVLYNWYERLYIERLERKLLSIQDWLQSVDITFSS
jgi:hypothetical protein